MHGLRLDDGLFVNDPSFRLSEITGVLGDALGELRRRALLRDNPDREVLVLIQDVIDGLKALDERRKDHERIRRQVN